MKTKDDAWFVPEGTDDILIRHEEKGGKYSYYAFQRGHGKDSYLMRAVGLNEEFYVRKPISAHDEAQKQCADGNCGLLHVRGGLLRVAAVSGENAGRRNCQQILFLY